MLSSQGKRAAANAVLNWIKTLELKHRDIQSLRSEMELVATGHYSKMTDNAILKMLNERFLRDSLGLHLSPAQLNVGKRKRGNAELSSTPWRIKCTKFRISQFNDDCDFMKPIVKGRYEGPLMMPAEDMLIEMMPGIDGTLSS